jgi:hypothetical protein
MSYRVKLSILKICIPTNKRIQDCMSLLNNGEYGPVRRGYLIAFHDDQHIIICLLLHYVWQYRGGERGRRVSGREGKKSIPLVLFGYLGKSGMK